MKKFNVLKNLLVLSFFVLCIGLFFGCNNTDSNASINNWVFTPRQATGTQISVVVTGNSLSFDFTVKNNYEEARELSTETFQVVITTDDSESTVSTLYFDEIKQSVSFDANQTKNVTLNAVTNTKLGEDSKIIIKYDGKKICEYTVNA